MKNPQNLNVLVEKSGSEIVNAIVKVAIVLKRAIARPEKMKGSPITILDDIEKEPQQRMMCNILPLPRVRPDKVKLLILNKTNNYKLIKNNNKVTSEGSEKKKTNNNNIKAFNKIKCNLPPSPHPMHIQTPISTI